MRPIAKRPGSTLAVRVWCADHGQEVGQVQALPRLSPLFVTRVRSVLSGSDPTTRGIVGDVHRRHGGWIRTDHDRDHRIPIEWDRGEDSFSGWCESGRHTVVVVKADLCEKFMDWKDEPSKPTKLSV